MEKYFNIAEGRGKRHHPSAACDAVEGGRNMAKGSGQISPEFIRQIPKTDLHLHLDGSLRMGTLIELAQAGGVKLPSYTEEGLRELVFKPQYADLREYLRGFAYTCSVLRTRENLERVAFELAEDNLREGVCYMEVRFAPQLHVHDGLSMEETVGSVVAGLQRAQRA
jgi:adenosine deaminase